MSSRSSLVVLGFVIVALLGGALLGYVGGRSAAGEMVPTIPPTSTSGSATTLPPTATPPLPTTVPAPTAMPTLVMPTAVVPTVSVPQPGIPTFAFEPQRGGVGTVVRLRGWGFAPGATVYAGVGFPTGGPQLAAVTVDTGGSWQTEMTFPALQLSPGPDWSRMHIVITDEEGTPLASAPFTWEFGRTPTIDGAPQAVRDLLDAYVRGRDPRPFLDAALRERLTAGETLDQALGLPSAALQSFTVGAPLLDRPSEGLFVPATLIYATVREERIFALVIVDGHWLVRGSFLEDPVPGPPREAASETVHALLTNFGAGIEAVRPLLARELRSLVDGGTPVHQGLGLPPLAWQSFTVGAPEDLPSEVLFVPATLTYPTFVEVRRFTLVVEDGAWRVTGSAPVRDPNPMPAEGAPDAMRLFLDAALADPTGEQAAFYAGGELRARLLRGETDLSSVFQEQSPLQAFVIEQVEEPLGEAVSVLARLSFESGASDVYRFTVSAWEEGQWRVFHVTVAASNR
ncbi:MAG TPA: hypothetical protein VNL77_09085 [Roseiflexaceae bacterium]|nr:hypothetical protein [Roseiflexaceae bacterium]